MPQTITVPNWKMGGTLSEIAAKYGTTADELAKANGITDLNQIKEGQTLIIPDKTTAPGSLEGTLPANPPTGNNGDRTLPEAPALDNLTAFKTLLHTVSQRAGQEARSAGVGALNFDPSKVSGGTLSGVLDFVNKQKTTGVADIYKSTTDFLDQQQKAAQDQLKTLIDSGAIANLTDNALSKLAVASGMDMDTLVSVRKQKQSDNSKPASFTEVNKGGKKVRIGFDKMGNIVSETPIGDETSGNQTEAELKRQAIKDMDNVIQNGTDPKTGGPILGQNGKIAPDNWSVAKQAWIKQGYSADDFDAIFETYQDPNNDNYE